MAGKCDGDGRWDRDSHSGQGANILHQPFITSLCLPLMPKLPHEFTSTRNVQHTLYICHTATEYKLKAIAAPNSIFLSGSWWHQQTRCAVGSHVVLTRCPQQAKRTLNQQPRSSTGLADSMGLKFYDALNRLADSLRMRRQTASLPCRLSEGRGIKGKEGRQESALEGQEAGERARETGQMTMSSRPVPLFQASPKLCKLCNAHSVHNYDITRCGIGRQGGQQEY